MGAGFGDSIAPLVVLVLGGVVMVGQGPAGTILLAAGRHRLVAVASVLEIALNVILSVALVSRYGLTGIAVGTALPYAILNAAVLIPVACRMLGVSIRRFANDALTPCLIALVPAGSLAMLLRSVRTPESLAEVFAQGALVGAAYVAGFWVFGLRSIERARYSASLHIGVERAGQALRALEWFSLSRSRSRLAAR
jgi:Polysaccharide biosynthesis C-terminal domain